MSNSRPSISSVTAWRHDVGEFIEIEIDNRLQSRGGRTVSEVVRKCVAPGGVFGLQGEQLGDGIAPALWPGASVGRSSIVDHRHRLLHLVAGAIAGLAFGVAKRVLILGL